MTWEEFLATKFGYGQISWSNDNNLHGSRKTVEKSNILKNQLQTAMAILHAMYLVQKLRLLMF